MKRFLALAVLLHACIFAAQDPGRYRYHGSFCECQRCDNDLEKMKEYFHSFNKAYNGDDTALVSLLISGNFNEKLFKREFTSIYLKDRFKQQYQTILSGISPPSSHMDHIMTILADYGALPDENEIARIVEDGLIDSSISMLDFSYNDIESYFLFGVVNGNWDSSCEFRTFTFSEFCWYYSELGPTEVAHLKNFISLLRVYPVNELDRYVLMENIFSPKNLIQKGDTPETFGKKPSDFYDKCQNIIFVSLMLERVEGLKEMFTSAYGLGSAEEYAASFEAILEVLD